MNLNDARQLAKSLMAAHGLTDWSFRFDTAVKRLGLCVHTKKLITISKSLTRLNPDSQVRNTLLHEIAHALVGPKHGHNATWRFKAMSIGCNGQRCTNSIVKVEPRYKVVCGMCGASWTYHRKPRNLSNS